MNKEINKKDLTYVVCQFKRGKNIDIKECVGCQFFNGYNKKGDDVVGLDCLYDDIPKLDLCRISSFVSGGYIYKRRPYDESVDGEIDNNNDYDNELCKKCCFGKELANGELVCTLTYAVDETCVDMFGCNDDEIYVKSKIKD